MSEIQLNRHEFESLASEILADGKILRFKANGFSMSPFIRDGDIIDVQPDSAEKIQKGDIILYRHKPDRLLAHRVVQIDSEGSKSKYVIQGDALYQPDGIISSEQVLGRVVAIRHNGKHVRIDILPSRVYTIIWIKIAPLGRRIYSALIRLKDRIN